MKIYFSYSLSQSSIEVRSSISKIINIIEDMGHTIVPKNLLSKSNTHYKVQTKTEKEKYQARIRKQKIKSDIVILEVSNNSMGLGQELAFALSINKPVIALYKQDSKPHILKDGAEELLITAPYTDHNIHKVLKDTIEYASTKQDVRFNMMIPVKLNNYLNKITKEQNISKAQFFRELLMKHQNENKN